jgi:hypothetical protein
MSGPRGYTLKYQPVSESELPAGYAFDKYGLVVLEDFVHPLRSPVEADVACTSPGHTISENGSDESSEDAAEASDNRTPRTKSLEVDASGLQVHIRRL